MADSYQDPDPHWFTFLDTERIRSEVKSWIRIRITLEFDTHCKLRKSDFCTISMENSVARCGI